MRVLAVAAVVEDERLVFVAIGIGQVTFAAGVLTVQPSWLALAGADTAEGCWYVLVRVRCSLDSGFEETRYQGERIYLTAGRLRVLVPLVAVVALAVQLSAVRDSTSPHQVAWVPVAWEVDCFRFAVG